MRAPSLRPSTPPATISRAATSVHTSSSISTAKFTAVRQLSGVKSKELKARLASHPIDKLPTSPPRRSAREQRQALLLQSQKQDGATKEPSLAERTAAAKENARQRRDALQQAQAVRRAPSTQNASSSPNAMVPNARHFPIYKTRAARTSRATGPRTSPRGVRLLARITGYNALTAFRHVRQDRKSNRTAACKPLPSRASWP